MENSSSSLLVAALLAGRKDLDYRLRARLIACAPLFDVDSLEDAEDALRASLGKTGIGSRTSFRITTRAYSHALRKTETWISRGVFVVKTAELVPHWSNHVAEVLFAWGDAPPKGLLWAAVLNSRKPRKIGPHEEWITATATLVLHAVDRGYGIVSSYGTIPYALTTHLACAMNHPVLLVWDGPLPMMAEAPDRTDLPSDLNLPAQGLVVSQFPPGSVPSERVRGQARDHLVGALAALVLVAQIRPRGNMDAVLDAARKRGATIAAYAPFALRAPEAEVDAELGLKPELVELIEPSATAGRFQPDPGEAAGNDRVGVRGPECDPPADRDCVTQTPLAGGLCRSNATRIGDTAGSQDDSSRPEVDEPGPNPHPGLLMLIVPEPGYLFHYTRACPGPWPGQTLGEYCRGLIRRDPDAAHTGFHTLLRILEDRLIRGSSRLVRGTQPVVSLTECLPWDLANLIQWRRGLARWSLELYGIGFDREFLTTLGADRVVYGDEAVFASLPDRRRHLFQLSSSGGYDWASEKEWRVVGDLALYQIPVDKMIVLVSNLDEARLVQARFGLPVTLADLGHVKSLSG
ncbi:MAG: hypothetical protein AB1646_12210 [Thermodesulfobacteriota bacterium]